MVDAKETSERARIAAEAANRATNEFLSNMSHEILTPLNAILGFNEILRADENDEEKYHQLDTIQKSGEFLLCMIKDILDFSKIKSGKLQLSYSSVSLHDMCQEMETIFSQEFREKGLDFRVSINSLLPDSLILDESHVRHVLLNIIGNAGKFTESGHVELSVDFAKRDGKERRIDLIVTVEDTGIGIPEEDQKAIFNAFTKKSDLKKKDIPGAGLGLAFAQSIISMMGGTITLESSVGEGSRFIINIPEVETVAAETESTQKPVSDLSTIRFKPANILIADDMDYNRELLAVFLGDWEFEFLFAENGKEALEKAKEHEPNCILLDMKMPDMDGYEASEKLKADDIAKDIPIIAVTASALKHDEERIAKSCDGFIRKPVSKTDLVTELRRFLPYTIEE